MCARTQILFNNQPIPTFLWYYWDFNNLKTVFTGANVHPDTQICVNHIVIFLQNIKQLFQSSRLSRSFIKTPIEIEIRTYLNNLEERNRAVVAPPARQGALSAALLLGDLFIFCCCHRTVAGLEFESAVNAGKCNRMSPVAGLQEGASCPPRPLLHWAAGARRRAARLHFLFHFSQQKIPPHRRVILRTAASLAPNARRGFRLSRQKSWNLFCLKKREQSAQFAPSHLSAVLRFRGVIISFRFLPVCNHEDFQGGRAGSSQGIPAVCQQRSFSISR